MNHTRTNREGATPVENRVLTVEEAAAYIPALLQEDWLLPLLVTGTSMTPFLRHRRDTV